MQNPWRADLSGRRYPRLAAILRYLPLVLVATIAWNRIQGPDRVLVGLLAMAALVVTLFSIRWPQDPPDQSHGETRRSVDIGNVDANLGKPLSAVVQPEVETGSLTESDLGMELLGGKQEDEKGITQGDLSILDMVNQLDPVRYTWIESSLAEQEFLGWTFQELKQKSFLAIVHAEDLPRAEQAFQLALERGETLGLVIRIHTARGKTRAVEVNVVARYGPDRSVTYFRCHVTDVTPKIRAERDLRKRTRELTEANGRLRRINRELEELKDRYGDLYQNAPAMYFSLDPSGRLVECNQTMLSTLERRPEELLGITFESLIPNGTLRDLCREKFAELLRNGAIEVESKWVKSSGEVIDVWISGMVSTGPQGTVQHTRCVAQDVTAKNRLESELQEKNQTLARANSELSRKNRELDEFVYVVSHDLQEPLRTLTAFSDFLLKEQGDRLDAAGRDHVHHLVNASRRMRAMIHGLLELSRSGKVTGEFHPVHLAELLTVVQADLRQLIRSRGAEVVAVTPLPTVRGDVSRLEQLLANLVGNGIKYNKSMVPRVELGVTDSVTPGQVGPDEAGMYLTLVVRDNGIGIDPGSHEKIFQPFRRAHDPEEYEGTGVGLSICRKIVDAHGGRIWVESQPGQGTTFFVTLPRDSTPKVIKEVEELTEAPLPKRSVRPDEVETR